MRLVAGVLAGLVVAFGAGWVMGASGTSALELERRTALERAGFAEARALVLDGRVSLYQVNFGDATRRFDEAIKVVARLQTEFREQGQAERAGRLEVVLTRLREAQRLTVSLDANAQNEAAEALKALGTGVAG